MTEQVLSVLLESARKNALHRTDTTFDSEIAIYIRACVSDLINRNAIQAEQVESIPVDPEIEMAVLTFVGANFGSKDDYDKLMKAYEGQKATMMTATGYTDWGEVNG